MDERMEGLVGSIQALDEKGVCAHGHAQPCDLDEAARDANDRRKVLPGMPQFFPQATWPEIPVRMKTLEFSVDPSLLKGENRVSILPRKKVTVRWVYLATLHQK